MTKRNDKTQKYAGNPEVDPVCPNEYNILYYTDRYTRPPAWLVFYCLVMKSPQDVSYKDINVKIYRTSALFFHLYINKVSLQNMI